VGSGDGAREFGETMVGETIRIVIVDDHPVISHGLRNVFAKDNSLVVVGEASETKEAVKVAERCKPDVIVLDISLGRGDGVSLIATLSKASPHSKVVMYTMHREEVYIVRSLQAGALGYVLKSDRMAEVVEAVKHAFGSRIYLSTNIPQTVLSEMLTGARQNAEPLATLTAREFEIAALMAKGMKVEEIGKDLHISPKTVRVHRTNIMHKFSCNHVQALFLQLRQHFHQ